jgi:hypothetical protein
LHLLEPLYARSYYRLFHKIPLRIAGSVRGPASVYVTVKHHLLLWYLIMSEKPQCSTLVSVTITTIIIIIITITIIIIIIIIIMK